MCIIPMKESYYEIREKKKRKKNQDWYQYYNVVAYFFFCANTGPPEQYHFIPTTIENIFHLKFHQPIKEVHLLNNYWVHHRILISHKVGKYEPLPPYILNKICVNKDFRNQISRSKGWQLLSKAFRKEWIMIWVSLSNTIYPPGITSETHTRVFHKPLSYVSDIDKTVIGKLLAPTKVPISYRMANPAPDLSF